MHSTLWDARLTLLWKARERRVIPPIMELLIWIGAALSVLGLLGVLWCIRKATWLRRVDPAEVDGQAELNRLMLVHMASICGAFLGLGVLVAGILLS